MPVDSVIANVPERRAVFCVGDADGLRFAVLQSPVAAIGGLAIGDLLMLAAADIATAELSDEARWPARLAEALQVRMCAKNSEAGGAGWAFLAAVAVAREQIWVCHVGDLRGNRPG